MTSINLREFANLCFAAVVAMRFPGSRIVIFSDSEVAVGWFNGSTTSSLFVDLAMAVEDLGRGKALRNCGETYSRRGDAGGSNFAGPGCEGGAPAGTA